MIVVICVCLAAGASAVQPVAVMAASVKHRAQMARRNCLSACVNAEHMQDEAHGEMSAAVCEGRLQKGHKPSHPWLDTLDTIPSGAEWLPEPSVDSCTAALETIVQIMRKIAWEIEATGSPMTVTDFLSIAAPNADTASPKYVIDRLDVPAVLVGHEERVSLSPHAIALWDTLLLSPYSSKRNVQYYAVVPRSKRLCTATQAYLGEVSAVYYGCNLGVHEPAEMCLHEGLPGFVIADVPLGDPKNVASTCYVRACKTIALAIAQARIPLCCSCSSFVGLQRGARCSLKNCLSTCPPSLYFRK